MLELLNKTSQNVNASEAISLGSADIVDAANRMSLNSNNQIEFNVPGKYLVTGIFNVSNTDSSDVNVTIEMYSNNQIVGIPGTITVPATTGFGSIVIEKTLNIKPTPQDTVATIQFITTTGATVASCYVDVYKRC